MAPFRRERLRFFFPDFFFSFLFQTETKKNYRSHIVSQRFIDKKKRKKRIDSPRLQREKKRDDGNGKLPIFPVTFSLYLFVVVEFRRPFLDFLFFNKKKRRKKQNGRESEVARRWRFFQFLFLVPLRFSD